MRQERLRSLFGALAAAGMVLALPAWAADLNIGISTDNSAMDPHFHNLTPNIMVTAHMFRSLSPSIRSRSRARAWQCPGRRSIR